MSLTFNLSGRTALVTGASSGLGRHFAGVLARHGARVAVAARRFTALESLAQEICDVGGRALPITLDVTDATSVTSAVDAVFDALGPIDILVNNSGVTVSKPLLDIVPGEWDATLDTNLKGAFLVTTQVARRLRDAGRGGCVINVASILGLRQAGHVAPYAASKAGLVQLTKVMALELARFDIRVNAIAPGYFQTDLNREFLASDAGRALCKHVPQRRFGRPADLDGPLLLLASDASRYMTGAVLAVDGGHLTSTL